MNGPALASGPKPSPPRLILRDAREHDRGAVGKFGDEREAPAHRLDGLPERRKQEVAPLLEPRHAVLRDPQLLRHARLRQLTRPSPDRAASSPRQSTPPPALRLSCAARGLRFLIFSFTFTGMVGSFKDSVKKGNMSYNYAMIRLTYSV